MSSKGHSIKDSRNEKEVGERNKIGDVDNVGIRVRNESAHVLFKVLMRD
jgi:hypothetical protein